jgi:hypothetical protein
MGPEGRSSTAFGGDGFWENAKDDVVAKTTAARMGAESNRARTRERYLQAI